MKNLLAKVFKSKQIKLPEPEAYPKLENVREWMDQKVDYYAQEYPDKMDRLFNPSSGDYLPLSIAVGAGQKSVTIHLDYYRKIKAKYPEAVATARKNYQQYSHFPRGDKEDYPSIFNSVKN